MIGDMVIKMQKIMNNKKTISILAIVLCLLMLLCGCKGKTEETSDEESAEGLTTLYGDESLGIDPAVDEQLKDYRLIALFGIDNGDRNDMDIIISINKNDGTAKLVSVVRDSYVQILEATADHSAAYNRCNLGYPRGGKYEAMKVLNRNLDLNIRECICVDWACAAHLIDKMGGITVDVDEGMLDWINNDTAIEEYGGENYTIPSAGTQTLNGWQAVEYLRVRKYDNGGTIARAHHNEDVFLQLYEQAKGMSAAEIAEVYDEIADELDTNMSRNTLTDTLAQISTTDIEKTDEWPYEWTQMEDAENGYRVPMSLLSNVKELHKVMFGQEDYVPSTVVQEINDGMIEAEKSLVEF